MTAALQFSNLTLGYDRHPAVHHLDGAVETGALVAVVGPNGAGKSTLFKGILGLIPPLSGAIDRTDLKRRDIAYLPQAADIDRGFPINLYDLVAMGLWQSTGLFGGIGRKHRDNIEHAIAAVGLTGFEERPIGTLSTGQMQRALFARLLLQDARVIVLDEPFNAVDAKTGQILWRHTMENRCNGREFCEPGVSAAVTAIPDVVFAGHVDGWMRAYDGATGKLVWEADTTVPVKTVNGTMATGGSMSGPGAAVSDGYVLFESGYNFALKMPGNVLYAYTVDGK